MRSLFCCVFLSWLLSAVGGTAAETQTLVMAKPSAFTLPLADTEPAAIKFSEAEMGFVQSWIKQKAPECPPEISGAAAQQFLEELQQRYPDKFDQLTAGKFTVEDLESDLLRCVALKLTGAAHAPAREQIARRRLAIALAAAGLPAAKDAGLMEKIQEASQSQYRRLVEGRMDDDELQLLLKKTTQVGVVKKDSTPEKAKVLNASDIVAEFSRHNQTGSSLLKLQAYALEGSLKPATGEPQELLLFRMRPDSFRLVVQAAGATRYILAANGGRFWQSEPGRVPQAVSLQALGQRRYLSEFSDPLFASDNYAFERLDDGSKDGKKFYRIGVKRSDASHYVARIDTENFREVGRENEDHSTASYSDFREVGGVIYAFREEVTDQAGRTAVLQLSRISPNPGLIRELFEPSAKPEAGYFQLESYLTPASSSSMKLN